MPIDVVRKIMIYEEHHQYWNECFCGFYQHRAQSQAAPKGTCARTVILWKDALALIQNTIWRQASQQTTLTSS